MTATLELLPDRLHEHLAERVDASGRLAEPIPLAELGETLDASAREVQLALLHLESGRGTLTRLRFGPDVERRFSLVDARLEPADPAPRSLR